MLSSQELDLTANRFLDIAEFYLQKTKEDFGMDVSVTLPLSQSEFDMTIEALSLIQERGKERGICAEVNDASDSFHEYGHERAIRLKRI